MAALREKGGVGIWVVVFMGGAWGERERGGLRVTVGNGRDSGRVRHQLGPSPRATTSSVSERALSSVICLRSEQKRA